MGALLLGLAAGTSPSPHTLALVIHSLQKGLGAGVRFLLGGLVWDLLLIALLRFLVHDTRWIQAGLPVFQIAFGGYLIWLGLKAMRSPRLGMKSDSTVSGSSFLPGFLVQALNPNALFFWSLVGIPKLQQSSLSEAIAFTSVFLVTVYFLKFAVVSLFMLGQDSLFSGRIFAFARQAMGAALAGWGAITLARSSYVALAALGFFMKLSS